MPDETNRQDNEKDTQSELPTENQPTDVEEQNEAPEGSLPEDVKERTKAEFEKLKKANRELKSELVAKQQSNKKSVLDSLRPEAIVPSVAPRTQQPQVQQQQSDDFVDAEGYVDTARLKSTLKKAQTEAEQAKIAAQRASQKVTRYTETEEMRRVHKDYPTLDPDSKDFDPTFFDLVRDNVISQMTRGTQDVYSAAQKMSEIYKSDTQKAEAEQDAKVQATTTAKEQINASGSSAPKRGTSQEELVKGTMQGDRAAMYERMKNSGF